MEKSTCSNCGKENPVNYKYCFECGYELPKIISVEVVANEKDNHSAKNKKISVLGMILFVIAFLTFFFGAQYFFFSPGNIDKNLLKIASQLNESCPMMADSETRLDNAMAFENKVFQYNYTLINVDINEANPNEMKKILTPQITNIVKTSPDMKSMRDIGVTFKYSYKDKNGIFMFDVTLGPGQYQ